MSFLVYCFGFFLVKFEDDQSFLKILKFDRSNYFFVLVLIMHFLFVKSNGVMNGGMPALSNGYYPLSAPNTVVVCTASEVNFILLVMKQRRI